MAMATCREMFGLTSRRVGGDAEGNISRTWLAAWRRRVVGYEWRIAGYKPGVEVGSLPDWPRLVMRLGRPGQGSESWRGGSGAGGCAGWGANSQRQAWASDPKRDKIGIRKRARLRRRRLHAPVQTGVQRKRRRRGQMTRQTQDARLEGRDGAQRGNEERNGMLNYLCVVMERDADAERVVRRRRQRRQ